MKPLRNDTVPWKKVDGRAIVLQPQTGKVHELNPVATLLWTEADGQKDLGALAQAVSDQFDVTVAEATQDVADFFSSLSHQGLVTWKEADC